MALKKSQGSVGETRIIAEAVKRGYQIAIPFGEDWRYDLIVLRGGLLERVQCKYTRSDGRMIIVRCRSANNWNVIKYTCTDFDWLAVYDATSDECYFVPSKLLGTGRAQINLRLLPSKNNQQKNVMWARDFIKW